MKTLQDLIDQSLEEPHLRQWLDLFLAGRISLVLMLVNALWWYVHALQTTRKMLIEVEDIRPRIYILNPNDVNWEGKP